MEIILIRPELLKLVKQGKKTTTCRNGKRNYPLGKTILKDNSSEDYIYINITKLQYSKLKDITDETAQNDRFADRENLIIVLNEIYTGINEDSDVTIVYFSMEETK
jgi:hypothetical protein